MKARNPRLWSRTQRKATFLEHSLKQWKIVRHGTEYTVYANSFEDAVDLADTLADIDSVNRADEYYSRRLGF